MDSIWSRALPKHPYHRSMVRLAGRATPQGRREVGAHRPVRLGRRPRTGGFLGIKPDPDPLRWHLREHRSCGSPWAGNDDPAPGSGGPLERDHGSWLEHVRARPANRAATGSTSRCPAPGQARHRVQERVAVRPGDLVVRPGLLRQTDCVRPQTDANARRRRSPDAAMRHARHVPQPRQRPRGRGPRGGPWPVRLGAEMGSHRRAVPQGQPLLHGFDRLAVRLEGVTRTARRGTRSGNGGVGLAAPTAVGP